jgi:hypothetical protein
MTAVAGLAGRPAPVRPAPTGAEAHPEAVHPEAVHPEAVHPEAVHPEAVHLKAVHLKAVHLKAVHPEAVHPEPAGLARRDRIVPSPSATGTDRPLLPGAPMSIAGVASCLRITCAARKLPGSSCLQSGPIRTASAWRSERARAS